ncbi:MAG: hypothetical protein DCC71_24120, partial [Proteobacteria bacterium]
MSVRALVRVALVLAALAVAAALLLPRWLLTDAVAARLRDAAREATGHPLAWDDLSLALFPPRLVATRAVLGDPAAPLVVADRIDLRVRALPLLRGELAAESLSLDGVTWTVRRTAQGLQLPFVSVPAAAGADAAPRAAEPAQGGGDGTAVAIDALRVERSHVIWEDVVQTPPVRLELHDVAGDARVAGAGEPLALSLGGTLASGGTLRIERAPAADAPDLAVTLAGVDLAPFAPYLGRDLALAGRADGTLRARGPASALDALDADLEIASASVRAGNVTAQGPVGVTARLRGALAQLAGDFSLDATRAELVAYGGAFRKPPGAPATASGRLVRDARGRLGVDGVRLQIKNMDGRATPEPGAWRLDAAPFDLAGWGELLPALAPLAPEGRVALGGVRVATAPLAIAGRIRLDGVVLRPGGRGPLVLRGALVGDGDALRSEQLVASVGGQDVAVSVALTDLAGAPRQQTRLAARDADAGA